MYDYSARARIAESLGEDFSKGNSSSRGTREARVEQVEGSPRQRNEPDTLASLFVHAVLSHPLGIFPFLGGLLAGKLAQRLDGGSRR